MLLLHDLRIVAPCHEEESIRELCALLVPQQMYAGMVHEMVITWAESSVGPFAMEFQLSCTEEAAPLPMVASLLLCARGWRLSELLRSCLSPLAARMTVSCICCTVALIFLCQGERALRKDLCKLLSKCLGPADEELWTTQGIGDSDKDPLHAQIHCIAINVTVCLFCAMLQAI